MTRSTPYYPNPLGNGFNTDYLIQLDEKPLSNGIKKFLKNEAVETVKYVFHNIVLRLFLTLQVTKEGK